MKKEYIITEIKVAPDGSPYVLVSLKDPHEVRRPQRAAFVPTSAFPSMDNMFKNLGQAISRQMISGFATVIKLDLNEYETLDIKVGDRISLEIIKAHIGIP